MHSDASVGRPPTSITRRSWVPTPIVRSPSVDLDVEAELAFVDDSLSVRDRAVGALGGGGDVLDADLEADRRLALGEVLEGEDRGGALHHPDHARRREDAAPIVPPTSVTVALHDELVGALIPGSSATAQTIPMPPETPSVSPVT